MFDFVCTDGFSRLYEWFYSSVQMDELVCTNGFIGNRLRFYRYPVMSEVVSHNGFSGFPQRIYSCSATDLPFLGEGKVLLVIGPLRLPRVAVGDERRLALGLLHKV